MSAWETAFSLLNLGAGSVSLTTKEIALHNDPACPPFMSLTQTWEMKWGRKGGPD